MSDLPGMMGVMAWDERGTLHCGNEKLYDCQPFTERGSRSSTDTIARRRGWRIWGDDANCPQCSKPARASRVTGSLEQEGLPGMTHFVHVPKARKSGKRESS